MSISAKETTLYKDVYTTEDSNNTGHIEMQSYTDKSSEDDEDEDDIARENHDELDSTDAGEDTPALRRRRRRLRLPPGTMATNSSTHVLLFTWLGVFGLLVAIFIGLYGYRRNAMYKHVNNDVRPSGNNNNNNNAVPKNAADGGGCGSSATRSGGSPVHYDPSLRSKSWNPFNLTTGITDTNPLVPPPLPWNNNNKDNDDDDEVRLGYLRQPDIVDGTLVFVSEGDLYWTRLSSDHQSNSMPAIKLTTTVGNVLTPKINPVHPNLIAYTATYQARRDVYLMDLSKPAAAQRLTYWPVSAGVSSIVGWKKDGKTLVFSARPMTVSLSDIRIFEIPLQQQQQQQQNNDKNDKHVAAALTVQDVPLAQALDGAFEQADNNQGCLYFTRFRQSSHTARYVGGTAESLWAYCHGRELAVSLTRDDYVGTSKTPSILQINGGGSSYLLFMSDRGPSDGDNAMPWQPASMNLWAIPLPTESELYRDPLNLPSPIQLTRVSCQFNGRSLQEYAVDPKTGGIVLRIGADLHYLEPADVQQRLVGQGKAASLAVPAPLPVQVLSDFHEHQERLLPVTLPTGLTGADIFETAYGSTSMLLSVRGQVWVAPVVADAKDRVAYQGAGQNLPARRYRVLPGAMMGGAIRVLKAVHVPLFDASDADESPRKDRLAVILATDPLSPTAEHAFYLINVDAGSVGSFVEMKHLPKPFLGGHVNGGSTRDGGLGSVYDASVSVSPCGRRMAWADTDGRICVVTIPVAEDASDAKYQVLPEENELGEPILGTDAELKWSPGGRYLAVNHPARNQFDIVTIVDCGDPDESDGIHIGRAVQVTPSRFNSVGLYWGKSALDIYLNKHLTALSSMLQIPAPEDVASTLFFLTDRDVQSDVRSPWGPRAPMPHFPRKLSVYALPLPPTAKEGEEPLPFLGQFPGEGALELFVDELTAFDSKLKGVAESKSDGEKKENDDDRRRLRASVNSLREHLREEKVASYSIRSVQRFLKEATTDQADSLAENATSPFPKDIDIEFGPTDLTLARTAFRLAHIEEGNHYNILSQTRDDGSLLILDRADTGGFTLNLFSTGAFPSDKLTKNSISTKAIVAAGESTSREHVYLMFLGSNYPRVVPNTMASLAGFLADFSVEATKNVADTSGMAISVWPALEYQQMYGDAWRMLRDYFYDVDMHKVDWPAVYDRYKSLAARCSKREELDDVLAMVASELSALHVFVYGGEYNAPFGGDAEVSSLHEPADLGALLQRAPEWKGYEIKEIAEIDPDSNLVGGIAEYSPVSDRALRLSGQKGLAVGDVIVGINGESVMSVPDIHMLLRGMSDQSVRLEVLRLKSGTATTEEATPESIVTVPVASSSAATLRYEAWEWKTRQKAKELAAQAGFTVGYIHMKSMVLQGENEFARNFYPDYDKDALILDLRHNGGGNIDSWILDALQRKSWMFWGDRVGVRKGSLDWDEQFAFRGHVVVLINEHTGSDAEGVSRGISELGLGRLIGTRTWGGGIWLSSDNHLVDGGIATAPEIGTFNSNFGWGLGIEQQGVKPDIEVDNNPRTAYDGKDTQLERAIAELKTWLKEEPIVMPKAPTSKPDMSLKNEECPA